VGFAVGSRDGAPDGYVVGLLVGAKVAPVNVGVRVTGVEEGNNGAEVGARVRLVGVRVYPETVGLSVGQSVGEYV